MSTQHGPARAVLAALVAALLASAAQASSWPPRHAGRTLQPRVQHPLHIGNLHHSVPPLGGNRAAPKTPQSKHSP